MCGFAGVLDGGGRRGSLAARRRVLARMAEPIAHRGPDDSQVVQAGPLDVAFHRLSVVDLAHGAQPIWNEGHTVCAVVNGEIYNHVALRRRLRTPHRFGSRSDSEIVVHLYEERGEDALGLLDGMFALAIWDAPRRRLLLARDRFGIKPLYYHAGPDHTFLFGSELKALLRHPACPREIDWSGLDWITRRWGPVPAFVRGVHHLPAATYLIVEPRGAPSLHRYWSLEEHFGGDEAATPAAEYVERYRAGLEASVKARLMSDVPVGIFLSGGVDSALIAALAARSNRDVHCFTVVTEATRRNGDAPNAVAVARHLGLPIHAVEMDQDALGERLDLGLGAFEQLIWMLDSPRIDTEWLLKRELHRYARTACPQLKVILIGQGADEFTGGYSRSALHTCRSWAQFLRDEVRKAQLGALSVETGLPSSMMTMVSARNAGARGALRHAPFHVEMLSRLAILQFHNLWHEDRTSMSQGVEDRVPYLHHPLVELLASVPPRLHPELFWDKRILRDAAAAFLPPECADRPKMPFVYGVPERPYLGILRRLVERTFPAFREAYLERRDSLLERDLISVLARQATRFEQKSFELNAGEPMLEQLLTYMSIAVFERLCRQAGDGVGPRPPGRPSPLRELDPDTLRPAGTKLPSRRTTRHIP